MAAINSSHDLLKEVACLALWQRSPGVEHVLQQVATVCTGETRSQLSQPALAGKMSRGALTCILHNERKVRWQQETPATSIT